MAWKQDAARVSQEKHEIAYVRKLAKGFLAGKNIKVKSVERICKLLLKAKWKK